MALIHPDTKDYSLYSVNTTSAGILATTALSKMYTVLGLKWTSANPSPIIELNRLSLAVTAAAAPVPFLWEIRLSPTVSGTFAYTALTPAALTYALGDFTTAIESATTTTGGTGTLLYSGYSNGVINIDIPNRIKLGSTVNAMSDTIVISVATLTASSKAYGSLTWKEYVN